jgi:hypothetical protein
MAIKHKRKSTTGYSWSASDLEDGQIGLNTADGTLHILKSGTAAIADFYPSNAQQMSGTVTLANSTAIKGDWGDATLANRPYFQASSSNNTYLNVVSSGATSATSRAAIHLFGSNDLNNCNFAALTARTTSTLPYYLAVGSYVSGTLTDPTVAFSFTKAASGTVFATVNPAGPSASTDLITKTFADSTYVTSASPSLSGTITLASATRIQADWNNSTYGNRPAFQSNSGNNTYFTVLANTAPGTPSSTPSRGAYYAHSTNDPANSNVLAITCRNSTTVPFYIGWGSLSSGTSSDPTLPLKFSGFASGTVYATINPSGPSATTDLITKTYADAHYGGGLPSWLVATQTNTGSGSSGNETNEVDINPSAGRDGNIQSYLNLNTVTSVADGPQIQIMSSKSLGGGSQASIEVLDYAASGGPASTQTSQLYMSVGNTGSTGYDTYMTMTPVAGTSGIQLKAGPTAGPVGTLTLEANDFNVNSKNYGFSDPVTSDPIFGFNTQTDGSVNMNLWPGYGTGSPNMANFVVQSYPFAHANTHWMEFYAGTTGSGTLSPENCHIGVGRVGSGDLSVIPLYISNNGGSTMYTTGSLVTIGADAASDGFQYGSLGGNTYLSITGTDFIIKTLTTQRFNIDTNGAFKIGSSADAGTAGQVLTSGGASAEPVWSNPAPVYTLSTLPTAVAGHMITVSDANSGAGALCYSDGSTWKDAGTHLTVV